MNIETPFIVATSDRSIYSEEINTERRDLFERQLTHRGLDFKRVAGSYKGTPEVSYIILTPETIDEQHVLQLARRYGQDSVLIVDANRYATLAFLNEGNGGRDIKELKGVGFWRAATREEAIASEAYTLDKDLYYVTRALP